MFAVFNDRADCERFYAHLHYAYRCGNLRNANNEYSRLRLHVV